MLKFGLIVPTLNAGDDWGSWLAAFDGQVCKPETLLVIDSSSTDKTVSLAKKYGFFVKTISRDEFNHGRTRQVGLDLLDGIDVAVFLTQDAILSDTGALCEILEPFFDTQVAAVCGRQLPRPQANPIEAHARLYNYSSISSTKSIDDVKKFGLKTAFISNSFAAYRIDAITKIGGVPDSVIFGEDMYVATKLLQNGYKIAYAADACVYHSHDYSLLQEMKRYFDMGVFHSREPWIRQELGGAEAEGVKFVVSEFEYLLKHAFWKIPEGMLRTLLRYAGFRLGLMETRLPLWIKRASAMNKEYFRKN